MCKINSFFYFYFIFLTQNRISSSLPWILFISLHYFLPFFIFSFILSLFIFSFFRSCFIVSYFLFNFLFYYNIKLIFSIYNTKQNRLTFIVYKDYLLVHWNCFPIFLIKESFIIIYLKYWSGFSIELRNFQGWFLFERIDSTKAWNS